MHTVAGESTSGATARRCTVERMLYAGLLAAALALRLHHLGEDPLSAAEAAQTWPAWTRALGDSGMAPLELDLPVSALLFALQSSLFWILGAGGDAVARGPSAVVGGLLVLVPWLLRPVLGRATAVVLAALLAVDPVLIALSRRVDSAILTGFAALLTVACVLRAETDDLTGRPDSRSRRWLSRAAVAAGILLVSGPQFWNVLVMTGALMLVRRSAVPTWSHRLGPGPRGRATLRRSP
jgi:predicted membrane-bound mannosyltransferase